MSQFKDDTSDYLDFVNKMLDRLEDLIYSSYYEDDAVKCIVSVGCVLEDIQDLTYDQLLEVKKQLDKIGE